MCGLSITRCMRRTWRRGVKRGIRRLTGISYYVFGVLVSVIAANIQSLWTQGAVVVAGIVLAGGAYYFDSARQHRRVSDEKLEPLLTDLVLPTIAKDYEQLVDDPPEVRVNVMLLRRRDVFPLGTARKLWPWKQSLKVEFAHGDYTNFSEDDIKWAIDEGVCGTAIEYNKMIWSDLEEVEIHEWDMTQNQLNATQHLGSVISIPIYVPEDESKDHPVGVLNVDSQANLDRSQFDREVGKELKRYTNYIGSLV